MAAPQGTGSPGREHGSAAEFAADAVPFGDPGHALFGATGTLSHETVDPARRGWSGVASAA